MCNSILPSTQYKNQKPHIQKTEYIRWHAPLPIINTPHHVVQAKNTGER